MSTDIIENSPNGKCREVDFPLKPFRLISKKHIEVNNETILNISLKPSGGTTVHIKVID